MIYRNNNRVRLGNKNSVYDVTFDGNLFDVDSTSNYHFRYYSSFNVKSQMGVGIIGYEDKIQ